MPYLRHPRWARRILYVLRAILYALALAMGAGAVWWTPVTVSERMPAIVTDAWGLIALAGGALCITGALRTRYRFELTGLPLLVGATVIYAITIWDIYADQDTRLAQASAVSALLVSFTIRWIDLLVVRWRLVKEHEAGGSG